MNRITKSLVGFLFFLVLGSLSITTISAETTSLLFPISEGSFSQWVAKTGSDHYVMIDEEVCNGVEDYVWTNKLNSRDSYNLDISPVPNGATITKIEISPCASKNENKGKDSHVRLFYRLNDQNSFDSTVFSLTGITPKQLPSWIFQNISSIKTGTSSLEIGAVYVSGNKGVRLGRIAGVVTYIPLVAPDNLSVTSLSSSDVSISWNDVSENEEGFVIERSRDGVSGWVVVALLDENSTFYTDTNLSSNTSYYYRVGSFNIGATYYSSIARVTTFPDLPLTPSDLIGSLDTSTSAILSWKDNSDNEQGFKVERRQGDLGSWFEVGDVGKGVVTLIDYSLVPELKYVYRVKAYNTHGESGYSNLFVINGEIPKAPSKVVVTKEVCGKFITPLTGTWQDNSFREDGFELEVSTRGNYDGFVPFASISANTTSHQGAHEGCFIRIRSYNPFSVSYWASTEVLRGP